MTESIGPPLDCGLPKGTGAVEIYRSLSGRYSWRVSVIADDNSAAAIQAAKTFMFDLDSEIWDEVARRHSERLNRRPK